MKIKLFRKNLTRIGILLSLVFLIEGCEQSSKPPVTESAFILPEAATIVDFELSHDVKGRYSNDNTLGKWSLLFFGYTHCPDVCPTELFMLAEMMRGIEKAPSINGEISKVETPQVVFISVDPNRDTPKNLQQYAAFYHPGFMGVTGEQSMINRLTESIGVFHERVYYYDGKQLALDDAGSSPEGAESSYLINHSASIFLVDPAGKLHAIFTSPHNPETMIRDLAVIQESWH